jgi:flagellar hook-associated protein 3 FlgL
MMVDNAIFNTSDSMEKMNKLQNQISTGKLFQNASEDPVRASLSLSLHSTLRTVDSYVDTTSNTSDWMNASDYAFSQLGDIANRATTLIQRGLNETISDSDRATSLGTEMQTLVSQAVEIGNTSQNSQYIFSGYQINTKPFVVENDATQTPFDDQFGNTGVIPQKVTYNGDQGSMQRSLGPDQTVTLNVRGDQALQGFLQNLQKASEALIKKPYDSTSLQTALAGLQSSISTMDQYSTSNGARLRQVASAADFLDQVKIETKSLLTQKEDANVAEGIASLANQKTTYQAVLEVSQRAISALSLFDYLK